jgi:hypothetical protein
MAAENSPPCLKAERIASASASVTTNIPEAWRGQPGAARKKAIISSHARHARHPEHASAPRQSLLVTGRSHDIRTRNAPGVCPELRHPGVRIKLPWCRSGRPPAGVPPGRGHW